MLDDTASSSSVNGATRAPAAPRRRPSLASFFRDRWRGEVPLRTVLWWDMLCVGSVINLLAGLTGMVLFASDVPTALAAAVYFSPLPYNLFLVAAVWRSAGQATGSGASAARVIAVVWLALATML